MNSERLNPVALLSNAASGVGSLCARALAGQADGGLILADADETALAAAADALDRPPERVSTLAFDPGDRRRWLAASEFISAQYGRLDWAVITAPAPEMGGLADLDAANLSLRTAVTLLRKNAQGGAAILVIDAHAAMRATLLKLLDSVSREALAGKVRVNAIVTSGAESPAWRGAEAVACFDRAAFARLQRLSPRVARAQGQDLAGMLSLLLADRTVLNGAALVVDDAAAV